MKQRWVGFPLVAFGDARICLIVLVHQYTSLWALKQSDLDTLEASCRIRLWILTSYQHPKILSTADVVENLQSKFPPSDIIEGWQSYSWPGRVGTDFSDTSSMAEKFFACLCRKTLQSINNTWTTEPDPDVLEKTLAELESQATQTPRYGPVLWTIQWFYLQVFWFLRAARNLHSQWAKKTSAYSRHRLFLCL